MKFPGDAVRGSSTGRPIMVLLDHLGKRWTLRILWELGQIEAISFRELRAQCGDPSPTVLNGRLKELRALGFVALTESGYALTLEGETLCEHLLPLDKWARDWAASRSEGHGGA